MRVGRGFLGFFLIFAVPAWATTPCDDDLRQFLGILNGASGMAPNDAQTVANLAHILGGGSTLDELSAIREASRGALRDSIDHDFAHISDLIKRAQATSEGLRALGEKPAVAWQRTVDELNHVLEDVVDFKQALNNLKVRKNLAIKRKYSDDALRSLALGTDSQSLAALPSADRASVENLRRVLANLQSLRSKSGLAAVEPGNDFDKIARSFPEIHGIPPEKVEASTFGLADRFLETIGCDASRLRKNHEADQKKYELLIAEAKAIAKDFNDTAARVRAPYSLAFTRQFSSDVDELKTLLHSVTDSTQRLSYLQNKIQKAHDYAAQMEKLRALAIDLRRLKGSLYSWDVSPELRRSSGLGWDGYIMFVERSSNGRYKISSDELGKYPKEVREAVLELRQKLPDAAEIVEAYSQSPQFSSAHSMIVPYVGAHTDPLTSQLGKDENWDKVVTALKLEAPQISDADRQRALDLEKSVRDERAQALVLQQRIRDRAAESSPQLLDEANTQLEEMGVAKVH